jgi:hypothetical protein
MRALALATLLCACVSSPPPDVDAHRYNVDRVACGQEAIKRHDFKGRKYLGLGPLGATILDKFVPTETSDDDFTKACMKAKGYELPSDVRL